ncbi:MAG TPA: S9 family peptidase [Thermoanaerobaculia bacterium]|nr:S9 family peptidase [Thermoanaerobaculia bacterium]
MKRFAALLVLALSANRLSAQQPPPKPLPTNPLQARLARIFDRKEFEPKTFGPFRWMENGKAYTTLEAQPGSKETKDLVRYDAATGARRVLMPASRLVAPATPGGTRPPAAAEKDAQLAAATPGAKALDVEDYAWSDDGKKLLVFADAKKVWRRKTRDDYWLLDVASGVLHRIGASRPESSLMFAKLSPDGTRAAYVSNNDLWVEDVASGAVTRLTSDGSATIINGTADWVYEEELALRDAFRWSPDGKDIAFWRFDQSGVGEFSLINDTDTFYPVVTKIPYPKAGTKNSEAKIGIVSAAGGAPRWVQLPGDPRDTYIAEMEWVDDAQIAIQQLNRLQNTDDVWLADRATGAVHRMLEEKDAAWVDVFHSWRWLPGNRELLWLSERDGWRHAYAAPRDGGAPRLLTPGDFDLADVAGIDEKAGLLYFDASPGDSTRRYLYRVRLDGKGAPERVTPAAAAGTHGYRISPDGHFAVHTFSTANTPPVIDLVRLPSHERVRVLEDNAAAAAAVAGWMRPPIEFFKVDIGGGVSLDGWMIRPETFDPSKKYPLVMYVYGEPAGAEVVDRWDENRGLFHRALASAGYIVGCVDNRGTPALKGRAWRKSIYGEVGVLATADQTAAVKALLASRPYLDPERVASWGWSGVGSMTLNLLFRSPDVYKVGMSVAPVPDQALYDTIYQERYMGLPQQNAEGYKKGSPINFAEGLKGKLLLVHGSGDDNVHYQGSERLVNRLVALEKPFDFMVYPNRTHAINEGEGTSFHLHARLARYLLENMPPGSNAR